LDYFEIRLKALLKNSEIYLKNCQNFGVCGGFLEKITNSLVCNMCKVGTHSTGASDFSCKIFQVALNNLENSTFGLSKFRPLTAARPSALKV
jgi:hypothetical protein